MAAGRLQVDANNCCGVWGGFARQASTIREVRTFCAKCAKAGAGVIIRVVS